MTTQRMTGSVPAVRPVDRAIVERWSARLFGLAVILGLAARIGYGHDAPLWFDESFSGAIATQPDVASLVRWCLSELTGPGYYVPLWLWVRVAGASDAMLRLLSLLCAVGAPLVLWRWGHPDRSVRRAWAGAVLLSLPAIGHAELARPYAQLFALACLQAVLFRSVLDRPGWRRAVAWSSLSALLVLTHYSAAPLAAVQALLLLAILQRGAIPLWPALLPVIPVAAWAAVHLPFVVAVAGGGGTGGMAFAEWAGFPEMLFGVQAVGLLVLGCIGTTALLPAFRRASEAGLDRSDRVLAGSGVVATALVLAAATLHGGFSARYLTSLLPALLFALALWVRWSVRIDERPALGATIAMIAGTIGLILSWAGGRGEDVQHRFGLEPASAWLAASNPARLTFLWSDPLGAISPDRSTVDVAGFAFRRGGKPVTVDVVHPAAGEDASTAVLASADRTGATAILWMAKVDVASQPAPRIVTLDPRWQCRDFGDADIRALACRRDAVSPRARPVPSAR